MKPQKKPKSPIITANVRLLINVVGVIFVWRGVWSLSDRYLFPDHPEVSAIVSVLLGLIILYIEDRNFRELQ